MSPTRPGRQRQLLKNISSGEIRCSHCSMKFKNLSEMDRHLTKVHGLNRRARARVYSDMNIAWYLNYAPPGWWMK